MSTQDFNSRVNFFLELLTKFSPSSEAGMPVWSPLSHSGSLESLSAIAGSTFSSPSSPPKILVDQEQREKEKELKGDEPPTSEGVTLRPKKERPPALEVRSSAYSELEEGLDSPGAMVESFSFAQQAELRRKSAFMDISALEEDNHKRLLKKIKVAFKKLEPTITPVEQLKADGKKLSSNRLAKRSEWRVTVPIEFSSEARQKKDIQSFLQFLESADEEVVDRIKKSGTRLNRLRCKALSRTLPQDPWKTYFFLLLFLGPFSKPCYDRTNRRRHSLDSGRL